MRGTLVLLNLSPVRLSVNFGIEFPAAGASSTHDHYEFNLENASGKDNAEAKKANVKSRLAPFINGKKYVGSKTVEALVASLELGTSKEVTERGKIGEHRSSYPSSSAASARIPSSSSATRSDFQTR